MLDAMIMEKLTELEFFAQSFHHKPVLIAITKIKFKYLTVSNAIWQQGDGSNLIGKKIGP